MKRVHITVTVQQAEAMAEALDLFARLSIGQVGMIAEMVAMHKIPMYASSGSTSRDASPEICDKVRAKVEEVLQTLGYSGYGHSLGIGNERVPIAGHRAYEMSRVLEKVLAEYRNPTPDFRGVNYDGLSLRYTSDPVPEASVENRS